MRLQDKVVLVTASTRGIGLATVQACAKEGAIVYMLSLIHILLSILLLDHSGKQLAVFHKLQAACVG